MNRRESRPRDDSTGIAVPRVCQACGYDRRGTHDEHACPECGRTWAAAAIPVGLRFATHRHVGRVRLGIALCVLSSLCVTLPTIKFTLLLWLVWDDLAQPGLWRSVFWLSSRAWILGGTAAFAFWMIGVLLLSFPDREDRHTVFSWGGWILAAAALAHLVLGSISVFVVHVRGHLSVAQAADSVFFWLELAPECGVCVFLLAPVRKNPDRWCWRATVGMIGLYAIAAVAAWPTELAVSSYIAAAPGNWATLVAGDAPLAVTVADFWLTNWRLILETTATGVLLFVLHSLPQRPRQPTSA